ncbi:isopentenyl-diphosphate delta-isomerase (IPP isomerase) [Oceanobacillus iheyensis HTE831]|uniref:Isopentenyl-diphosphate delta-isomerase n=1 Tax=Oceanobacillus iheyensis (strain DSM 14371 / CIP 107618 / JCM 11309 / KCTC 3954 / HTE831) TaxID=221109 RepID=IDI2_OCEIH|nr:type 2 isopentenyl-diphosphate Delta-isomerase [Oceanobacillus iheyensis]Q8EST0.1 RecName: Full=Isopentenyl-diphosphate delta-isomerase; Short=IPP isomerase; AltName: Full=Isopentenyl diphosphate:dimethylallyl diphosphate isomerase; AltName: Full=Isopentenyl pyrophosphate isomerase; AltName: Full=Type 2 isopentenyl diphosphate isomerase; Short=IDI-2 [Oceanobacillus iheyensis HTE831]BAC12493.1 isopentenyl-diphosphate delta-isomerase (IPP isomerase) [Oceanobacillus iheyensis HTE831]
MEKGINQRKTEHIRLCLTGNVEGVNKSTGLEGINFIHNALPEIDFADISLESSFLGKQLKAPFLVSSMTGGSELATKINQNLAIAAEEKGWALAIGSTRAFLESDQHKESFLIRNQAPTAPLIVNIGAVQLNYGYGPEECQRIIDKTNADSIVLHLNSLQEAVQDGGDLNFKDLLPKIEQVCKQVKAPVGVKEVGFGIDGEVARRLYDAGISYIDVAGAGGTSWSQVEKLRSKDPLNKAAAEAFNNWGTPTKDCLVSVRGELPEAPLVASGGMKTGVDAAKAITIGADVVGFARHLLKAAMETPEDVIRTMEQLELELKMTMFGIGAVNLEELKNTSRVSIMGQSLMDK